MHTPTFLFNLFCVFVVSSQLSTFQNQVDILSIENRFYAKIVSDIFRDAAYGLNSTLYYMETVAGIRRMPLIFDYSSFERLPRRCDIHPNEMTLNAFRTFDAFINADAANVFGQKLALFMENIHDRLMNIYVYIARHPSVTHNSVTLDESSTFAFRCANMSSTNNRQNINRSNNYTLCLAEEFNDNLNVTNTFVRKFIAEEFKINGLFDDIERLINSSSSSRRHDISPSDKGQDSRNSNFLLRRKRSRIMDEYDSLTVNVLDCIISITRLFYRRFMTFYSATTNKLIYISREMPKLSK